MSRDSRAGRNHRYKYYLYIQYSDSQYVTWTFNLTERTSQQCLKPFWDIKSFAQHSSQLMSAHDVVKKKARPARVKFPRFNQLHSTSSSRTFKKCLESFLSHTHTLSLVNNRTKTPELGGSKAKESRKKKGIHYCKCRQIGKKSKPLAAHEEAQVCQCFRRFASSRVCPSACLAPCVCVVFVNRRSSILAMLH
jgi:hypothetical protein